MMELLEIIKWPGLILVIIIIFRKPIKEIIINVADFAITKDGLTARIGRPYVPETKNQNERADKSDDKTEASEKYFSKNREGEVIFDYSNNNGVFTIGEGENRFDTQWSKASNEYIYFYSDKPSVKSVRLSKDTTSLEEVEPKKYDSSSRVRTARIGQIAIFENVLGKFLAVKVMGLKDDSRGDKVDEIRFKYKILD